VAPIIAGMTMHFIFHIRQIFVLGFLYLHLFSASFCITFLSNGIASCIDK
jgi:hypothetical protein